MKYEAIGCGVYEIDSTAKPGDPRQPVACTGDDIDLNGSIDPSEYDHLANEQAALARRIADALNHNSREECEANCGWHKAAMEAVSETTIDQHIDKCALCGLDLRDDIHIRSQTRSNEL